MTREDQLYAMNGATLIMLADKLGVKVNCNRTRTGLKEAKSNVIERILIVENKKNESIEETPQDNWEAEANAEYEEREAKAVESDVEAEKTVNKKESSVPGRRVQLEFNGKAQNICAWAKELGISANTLYGRIYKMGWSVEKAFTTPARPLKKSKI